jgi:hypothetical protein
MRDLSPCSYTLLPKINEGYFLNSSCNNESVGDHFNAGSEIGTDNMSDNTENDDDKFRLDSTGNSSKD